jgi:beta-fructofuranosidase
VDEGIIISGPPEGLDLAGDFRDPYVFQGPGGQLQMLLGSRDAQGGVVLLYRTDDPTGASGWVFQAVLHRDGRLGMTVVECPCMVPLDGQPGQATRWALIYAQLESTDPATGRRNLSTAIVGRFDGESFAPEFERELDFGTSAYGYQALATETGPVGIAWLANWKDWDRVSDFPTAMTVPTRLRLSEGGHELLVVPADELQALRQGELDRTALAAGEWVPLGHGTAEILLLLAPPHCLASLEIATADRTFCVEVNADGLEITGHASRRLIALGAQPRELRIFLDAGSIEVFADGGRWTGTHRLPDVDRITGIRLVTEPGRVREIRAWNLVRPAASKVERTLP